MLPVKHAEVLNRLSKGEGSWDAPIPETYGTFLGRPLRLTIHTYVQVVSYIRDPSPPPTEAELALADMILDHLPALLGEAQQRFLHYNTEVTDDPEVVAHVVRPTVFISRNDPGGKTDQRWSLSVERDDNPIGYSVDFDGLCYRETWGAS